jgi:hypothetical protein
MSRYDCLVDVGGDRYEILWADAVSAVPNTEGEDEADTELDHSAVDSDGTRENDDGYDPGHQSECDDGSDSDVPGWDVHFSHIEYAGSQSEFEEFDGSFEADSDDDDLTIAGAFEDSRTPVNHVMWAPSHRTGPVETGSSQHTHVASPELSRVGSHYADRGSVDPDALFDALNTVIHATSERGRPIERIGSSRIRG